MKLMQKLTPLFASSFVKIINHAPFSVRGTITNKVSLKGRLGLPLVYMLLFQKFYRYIVFLGIHSDAGTIPMVNISKDIVQK